MSEIILTTLNAKYIHSAFGLRYLYANMGTLQGRTKVMEFTINERPHELVEKLLYHNPKIIGFGVYIWNVKQITEVLAILRKVAPEVKVIVGGPEVSYETESSPVFELVDYVVTGEADLELPKLCEDLLLGAPPSGKVIHSKVPDVTKLKLPYHFYTDEDVANRVVYVEASRGCPFTCEFCLSSLDIPVRQFELEPFLQEMELLYKRGVRHFKFVDRTFNLNLRTSKAILEFFLDRYEPGMFVHFEMVPDRLPEALRQIIQKFPKGALQFEIGIQTFNPEVGTLISRRQDYDKLKDNIRWLRSSSGVHIHADLIVGLPGEDMESFASGFNTLVGLGPQEIQVGILKRLRGTPIIRHDSEWAMVYSSNPPYELLRNRLLSFADMQRLGRFSRFWDMVANSGNFVESGPLIWTNATGPFEGFMSFSDWLYNKTQERHGYSVKRLSGLIFEFLTTEGGIPMEIAGRKLVEDYTRLGASDVPTVLKRFDLESRRQRDLRTPEQLPERQQKHLN